jgi:hypothetical protein
MAVTDAASAWRDLKKHVEARRLERPLRLPQVQSSLIARLRELAHLHLCDGEVQGWFTTDKDKLTISGAAPAKVGDWPAIPLKDLEHIDDVLLTLSVTFDRVGVKAYSIQLRGKRRIADAPPWYARVDLDGIGGEKKGVGLCSHAVLHTHVGTTPESDHVPSEDPKGERKRFSTRVPTPWLGPVDALNWLLATVDRRLEPAPQLGE